MIAKNLLDILICPKCHEQLEYKSELNNLNCNGCGKVYRIENDIPIMILEEKDNDRPTQ
ncbi:MAG: Trm112 family protein [Bacteroidota bacterium]|nr:Trm112 family protein [Bacteroidota bacterium]